MITIRDICAFSLQMGRGKLAKFYSFVTVMKKARESAVQRN